MAAELQAITFREYLPALLGGTDHIPPYQRYNESVNVGMSNIMATAAFRFVIHTSYATITMEYLTSHLYFLGIDIPLSQSLHQELIQMISCRHSMVYHERAFDYYFIPRHAVSNTINATTVGAHGKVGCNTVEYATAFLYSDWLFFLWHGINVVTRVKVTYRTVSFSV